MHDTTYAKNAKETWDNVYATFEKQHVGNRLQLYQQFCNSNMEENTLMQVRIYELCTIVNQLTNIDHPIFNENMTFSLLGNYLPSFHTTMVAFSYCIDELYMELIFGQLV